MHYEEYRQNVQIATRWLGANQCDAWLVATRERSDPAVKAIFGSVVVGTGLYLVTKEGKAFLVANRIDIQEGRDSGVFDESFAYSGNFTEVAGELLTNQIKPGARVCLNYSPAEPMADGMKLGLWRKLLRLLPDQCDFCSSEQLLKELNLF